jgi:DNA-binding NarL/FixJ family response regulator
MRILIVEDDSNKYSQIQDCLSTISKDIEVTIKRSYQSGLKEILRSEYDLIILDMSMPTFDISSREPGGPFRTFGGEEILKEMRRKSVKCKIIILTQFESFGQGKDFITLEELKQKLSLNFPDIYFDTIYYNAAETSWKYALTKMIAT